MKEKRWKFIVLLLTMIIVLSGCTSNLQALPDANDPAVEAERQQLDALKAELETLRQKEVSYQAQIEALQARVAQLTAPDKLDELPSESVTFYYREESDGAVITGYSGNAALLTVPATLNGLPVIAIGEHAFEKASLTAVILPEGITRIEWFAFYECAELSGVTIPESVCSIGYAVFDGCPTLSLHCRVGSYAERYAQSYGIPYSHQ